MYTKDPNKFDDAELVPEITATDLAERAGTINYEILTNISNRVHRIYCQSK